MEQPGQPMQAKPPQGQPQQGQPQQGQPDPNNPYMTAQMVDAKKDLGVPDFHLKYIEGSPYHAQYQQSDNQGKCYIEAMWMGSQLEYYYNEKQKGNWYPALGPQEEWEKMKKQGASAPGENAKAPDATLPNSQVLNDQQKPGKEEIFKMYFRL